MWPIRAFFCVSLNFAKFRGTAPLNEIRTHDPAIPYSHVYGTACRHDCYFLSQDILKSSLNKDLKPISLINSFIAANLHQLGLIITQHLSSFDLQQLFFLEWRIACF